VTTEGVPKLLDFGIAKLLIRISLRKPWITTAAVRLMTPEYASPEQVLEKLSRREATSIASGFALRVAYRSPPLQAQRSFSI